MHQIHNAVWLGNAMDVRRPRELFELGIRAVVDLAIEEPVAELPRELIYCRIPLNDGGGNDPSTVWHALSTLRGLIEEQTPTLVACSAGMSRSPTIAAFAISLHGSESAEDVLARIATMRSLEINPTLWHDVAMVINTRLNS